VVGRGQKGGLRATKGVKSNKDSRKRGREKKKWKEGEELSEMGGEEKVVQRGKRPTMSTRSRICFPCSGGGLGVKKEEYLLRGGLTVSLPTFNLTKKNGALKGKEEKNREHTTGEHGQKNRG